ncbi:OLC1v1001052C2 [Oldenlandia corymbosa var. corymbosa]|uniref:3-hydroxyisobutyryl-CoA hydrolase n=1 Tax=Oldenlandia corymbosa var. corymbosa TaxID=529605 RepID=A0AAV1D7W6_OLDCO|nr:OLC1v1001052C2 [Oldenlandia corymbosa var. corymbosa]
MTFRHSFEPEQNQVLVEMEAGMLKMTLNRPRHLNSLTHQMVSQLKNTLQEHEFDPKLKLVLIKGNGKAFCVGGDVTRLIQVILAGNWSYSGLFYRKQLMLDYLVSIYNKPLVFFVNGAVMGGGAGLCLNGTFRVVTEKTVFAMPEVSIGLFPDVGVSYFLSRLPGHLGEFLGLTGTKLDGADMLFVGLASHFVPSKDLEQLESELRIAASNGTQLIAEVINKFAKVPNLKTSSPCNRIETINNCFSRNTVEQILFSLENEGANNEDKWIAKAIDSIKLASPTSLKLTLKIIRESRSKTLKECLARDYLMAMHFGVGTVNDDFLEGARAKFFQRDTKPKWNPSKLEEVTDEMIEQFCSQICDEDWVEMKLPDECVSKRRRNSKL